MVGLTDSIVISELGVGIDFQEEVVKKITQVSNMSLQEREEILDRANKLLPKKNSFTSKVICYFFGR